MSEAWEMKKRKKNPTSILCLPGFLSIVILNKLKRKSQALFLIHKCGVKTGNPSF